MSTHTPARELMHIWEIRSTLKCPVIGTCFDENENRALLKKSGYRVKSQRFYQLHAGIMENLHSENAVSLRVDRFLRNKYRQSIAELAGLPVDDFMEIWRERLKTGHIDDIFYIASTRPDLPDHSFSEIFGEMHMLGHTNMNSLMRARQEMDKREAANRKLETLLEKEKMRSSELKQALSGSEETIRAMRTRIRQLETVLMTLRQNDTDRPALSEAGIGDLEISADLRRLEADNRKLEKDARRLEREKRKLQIEMFDLKNANRELSDETSVLIAKFSGLGRCNGENCTAACPEYDSCPRRILMVGGLTRLKALYREAVESVGSEFEYHDGYMKNGKQAIEAGIKRCDMVLCPVNCNSHGACDMVKRLCRKYDKPMRMLSSSSLSAVLSVVCGENSHNVLN